MIALRGQSFAGRRKYHRCRFEDALPLPLLYDPEYRHFVAGLRADFHNAFRVFLCGECVIADTPVECFKAILAAHIELVVIVAEQFWHTRPIPDAVREGALIERYLSNTISCRRKKCMHIDIA